MFQIRNAASMLLVCAFLQAQEATPIQAFSPDRRESAPTVVLSPAPAAAGRSEDGSYFTLSAIDPDSIVFSEFEEGRYSASLRIDARSMPAVRLHFSSFLLPEGAELFVYSDVAGNDGSRMVAGPYRGAGPVDSDFWSEALPGGTIVVELQVRGEAPAVLPFELDLVEQLADWKRSDPATPKGNSSGKKTSVYRGEAIEHEVVDGVGVFEGDILLGNVDELQSALPDQRGKDRSKSAIGQTSTYYRWTNGIVPYVIDASIAYPANVTAAVNHWNTALAGVISLVPRTNQTDHIRFVSSSGCSSFIGRIGGQQNVQLASGCGIGNIIHEIGHAIGLFHEQSREDRNTWVKINTANISANQVSNFNQFATSSDDLVYYAYNSIMHYSATSFSANGLPTITTIPAGIPIGQRTALDISDIAAVRKMYGKQTPSVSISTVPAGLPLTVDGISVITPATFNWPAGSVHTITAGSAVAAVAPSQYKFVRWSDGGALTHTVTVPATGLAVAATYALQHKLTTSVLTALTGTLGVAPAASDAFYAQGSAVTVAATPASGYCFTSWSGLSSGTPNETAVSMTRSVAASAKFIPGAVTPGVSSVSISKTGGAFTMNTSASTGCGWMVKSSAPWLTVSKAYATSAAPSFTYTAQANTTGVARTATLKIDSKLVTVTQAP